jgi:hypothetical protein
VKRWRRGLVVFAPFIGIALGTVMAFVATVAIAREIWRNH